MKKVVVLLMSCMLVVGMLSGCGKEPVKNETEVSLNTDIPEATEVPTPEPTEEVSEDSGWPEIGLATLLPDPGDKEFTIWTDTEEFFNADISDVSNKEFNKYVKKCQDNGFTVDRTLADGCYYASNNDNIDLALFLIDGLLNVQVLVPAE